MTVAPLPADFAQATQRPLPPQAGFFQHPDGGEIAYIDRRADPIEPEPLEARLYQHCRDLRRQPLPPEAPSEQIAEIGLARREKRERARADQRAHLPVGYRELPRAARLLGLEAEHLLEIVLDLTALARRMQHVARHARVVQHLAQCLEIGWRELANLESRADEWQQQLSRPRQAPADLWLDRAAHWIPRSGQGVAPGAAPSNSCTVWSSSALKRGASSIMRKCPVPGISFTRNVGACRRMRSTSVGRRSELIAMIGTLMSPSAAA